MARHHQPGQSVFRLILPEDIEWKPFPAFPAGARLAVVVGHPTESGPYPVRVKVLDGPKLMPHKHPEDRIYTVMSGVFYIGLGETFDGDKLNAYPPGSVIVLASWLPTSVRRQLSRLTRRRSGTNSNFRIYGQRAFGI